MTDDLTPKIAKARAIAQTIIDTAAAVRDALPGDGSGATREQLECAAKAAAEGAERVRRLSVSPPGGWRHD